VSEAIKWKILLHKIEEISLFVSIKAVLAGLTYGILTPARSGEVIGRPLFLKEKNFSKGVFATAAGSIAQLSVTLIAGFVGIIFYALTEPTKILIEKDYIENISIVVSLVFITFVLFGYFNISYIAKLTQKVRFLKRVNEQAQVLTHYSKLELLKVLLLSLFRYLVFATQFYLLLTLFGIKISILTAYMGIAMTYFVATIIPVATLAEIGIRSSVAIYFLGNGQESNEIEIATSAAAIWLLNVGFPTIVGGMIWVLPKKM